jgi:gas vesicle protein
MTSTSKIVLGILGAVAAGVAIGVLIAPEKGSEMRKRLKKSTGEWADTLSHLFDRAKDGVDDLKQHVKRTSKEMPTGV